MFHDDAQKTARSLIALAAQAREKAQPKRRSDRTKAQRNLAIFKKVAVEHCTHDEVAHAFKLHRSRVTQIVTAMRQQLAGAAPDDPDVADPAAHHRLNAQLERLQYEHALEAAAKAMRNDPPRLVTNRAGARNKGNQQEGWSETVTRDKAPNVQTIKTFLRVAGELSKLRQREAEANPPPAKPSYEELFDAIYDVLFDWKHYRLQFEDDPPSRQFIEMVSEFAQNIFIWTLNRKQGRSRIDAWPSPRPASANHAPSETNLSLTTDSSECIDSTSDAPTT